MVARSILLHRLRCPATQRIISRTITSSPKAVAPAPQPLKHAKPQYTESWLTQKVRASPTAKNAFLAFATLLGYNTKKQIAGRRSYVMYEKLCAVKADEEKVFWQQDCRLPPTFQSWFTVTNLHVWMLTVRLRALPAPHATYYVQSLVDHFFYDVEDRIRVVLQPGTREKLLAQSGKIPSEPRSLSNVTEFYTIPNVEKNKRANAPERLVTRQMKIMREQWAGMGMAFDLGLLRGDAELAAAVWRNFLGARGARGIVYPSSTDKPTFRRSINLVGGDIVKVADIDKQGLEAEEAKDDNSGLHDFAPDEAGLYVQYPELMARIVSYMRQELVRLENIPDTQILGKEGDIVQFLQFGRIRD